MGFFNLKTNIRFHLLFVSALTALPLLTSDKRDTYVLSKPSLKPTTFVDRRFLNVEL